MFPYLALMMALGMFWIILSPSVGHGAHREGEDHVQELEIKEKLQKIIFVGNG